MLSAELDAADAQQGNKPEAEQMNKNVLDVLMLEVGSLITTPGGLISSVTE